MGAAAPASAGPNTRLTFSIAPEIGVPRSVTLTCQPTGGTHPDAEAACADLIKANGVIERIPPGGGYCQPVERRVVASATGLWNGRLVSYERSFTNDCYARIATGGHVFHF
ncbi:SSI family serine proteinase inhibitor [Spirillospora sp. NPDC047279]|uniref:SSI family serine proteinase inhibitor n=1 Tax=Spirillospora sp. NPDC047279 TaxID=3155478 RepID=UPI00340E97ED